MKMATSYIICISNKDAFLEHWPLQRFIVKLLLSLQEDYFCGIYK